MTSFSSRTELVFYPVPIAGVDCLSASNLFILKYLTMEMDGGTERKVFHCAIKDLEAI